MFKSRSKKKSKIKAVFKLQFQATQVPTMKKPVMMVALVPDDVGKPTVKLEKVAVQDGICLWENPIFESVKLVKDTKSGKLQEKIYHFVVSTGSSKSGFLGESSIDFADFAAETEPLTVSLPLKFANSGAILHVTIQNVEVVHGDQSSFRNWEDNGNGSSRHLLSICSADEGSHIVDKDFLQLLPPLRQNSMPSRGTIEAIATRAQMHRGSIGSASDRSLGDYRRKSLEATLPLERLQEPADNVAENLKSEVASLKRKAEELELELQSLQKLMEKECSRGQSMSRQIINLREERNMFKTKYEQLMSQKNLDNETKSLKALLQTELADARQQLEATKEELVYEKEFSSNLQLQLQKTQNSNSELLLAVRELEELLEQKNKELLDNTKENDDATELKQKIADHNGEIDNCYKQCEELNEHIKELNFECAFLKKENLNISLRLKHGEAQEVVLQNKHSASLATIELLESQAQRLEENMKKQANDFSETLIYINELESQVSDLERELKTQAEKFEEDFHAMKCAKLGQEERAIQAEETLIDTRHNNGLTCQRFQDEYRSLSVEMTLKVEENEKKFMEAYAEADELRKQKKLMEEILQKCNQELKLITNQNESKLQQLLNQIDSKEKTLEMMSQELEIKSKQLEDVQRYRDEQDEALSKQIQLLRIEIRKLMATEEHDALSKTEPKEHMITMSMQENNDDEEIRLGTLMSEVEIFKTQHNELKHNLQMEQAEKENMKKKISQLEGELKKKEEEELSAVEKRLKNSREHAIATNMDLASWHYESAPSCSPTKEHNRMSESEMHKGMDDANTPVGKSKIGRTMCTSAENKVYLATHTSEVKTCLENEVIVFNNDDHAGDCDTNKLLNEVEVLKERNKYMRTQLKEMEERYSEISLKFAEVEGERQQLVMALRNLRNGKN